MDWLAWVLPLCHYDIALHTSVPHEGSLLIFSSAAHFIPASHCKWALSKSGGNTCAPKFGIQYQSCTEFISTVYVHSYHPLFPYPILINLHPFLPFSHLPPSSFSFPAPLQFTIPSSCSSRPLLLSSGKLNDILWIPSSHSQWPLPWPTSTTLLGNLLFLLKSMFLL
jgi:hypothetical protein